MATIQGRENDCRWVGYNALMDPDLWVADVRQPEIAAKYFKHSSALKDDDKVDFFISHCWSDPGSWEYGKQKQREFKNQLKGHIEKQMVGRHRTDMKFWMDKCCIPQMDIKAKQRCVANLEQFIHESSGSIVLMNAYYLTRLWCLYEWACFLLHHPPDSIFVGFWHFTKNSAEEAQRYGDYFNNLRKLEIDNLQCAFEVDRQVLLEKVDQYYKSQGHFVRFVKITIIALIVRDLMWGGRRLKFDCTRAWQDLAEELGYPELQKRIQQMQIQETWIQVGQDDEAYLQALNSYLKSCLYPYLVQERDESCHKAASAFVDSVVPALDVHKNQLNEADGQFTTGNSPPSAQELQQFPMESNPRGE